MIQKPAAEAREIYQRYDRELPFVFKLSERCQQAVWQQGYLTLYGGARRHWNKWAPGCEWQEGAAPCDLEEAKQRVRNPAHKWFGQRLYRVDVRLAMNALIQGSSAYHTKLWMRECYRAGIIPLLQMHDALELSVPTPEQTEIVAQLGCNVVADLEVPMKIDVSYGHTWGDAKHTWTELHDAQSELPTATRSTPAYQVNWEAALAQDFPCVSNGGDRSTTEIPIAAAAEPARTEDDDSHIRRRMAEEGIPWENPSLAAQASPSTSPPPPPARITIITPVPTAIEQKRLRRWLCRLHQ
jgi:hypothetical protein